MQHFSLRAMFCCCSLSWSAFFFLRGLPLLRLSLALLVENHIFGKVAPAFACYFFYATFPLGKLRFPRKKLHKKSKTPTGFYFSEKIYAEREGFEPPDPCGSTVFKTAAIDHSATSPRGFPISFIGLQIRLSHCFPSSLRLSSYCGRFFYGPGGD